MNKLINLPKEILILTEVSAAIASDDFILIENKIKKYKKNLMPAIKLYECILQSYLFCGFPAAIESLKIFKKYFSDFVLPKSNYNLAKFRNSGKINCKLIYKKNYKKLIENMNYFSPDLKEWMIIEGYGKVLNRKRLSLLEREYVNVSILCTRLYVNQLHSHMKGCIHLGANIDDLTELLMTIKNKINEDNFNKALQLIEKLKDKS